MAKIWSLQALRFWAALGVCIFHALGAVIVFAGRALVVPDALIGVGQSGVDVFFVLSGLIIAVTAPGMTPAAFLTKRAARIYPMWWLAAGLPGLFIVALKGEVGWRTLIACLTLWPATDHIRAPLGVGWTLSFEVLFYAAAALVLWRRWFLFLLLGLWLLANLFPAAPVLTFIGNPLVVEFLLGVAVSRLPTWRYGAWFIPVGIAALVVAAPHVGVAETGTELMERAQGWGRVVMFGLPAALIVYGAYQLKGRDGWQARLGDASYAFYLLHAPLLVGFCLILKRVPFLNGPMILVIIVAATVLLTWRVHELIEKPILSYLRRPGILRPA